MPRLLHSHNAVQSLTDFCISGTEHDPASPLCTCTSRVLVIIVINFGSNSSKLCIRSFLLVDLENFWAMPARLIGVRAKSQNQIVLRAHKFVSDIPKYSPTIYHPEPHRPTLRSWNPITPFPARFVLMGCRKSGLATARGRW